MNPSFIPTSTVESLIQQNKNLSQQVQIQSKQRDLLENRIQELNAELKALKSSDNEQSFELQEAKVALKKITLSRDTLELSLKDLEKQFAENYSRFNENQETWAKREAQFKKRVGLLERYHRRALRWLRPLIYGMSLKTHKQNTEIQWLTEQNTQFKKQLEEAYQHVKNVGKEKEEAIQKLQESLGSDLRKSLSKNEQLSKIVENISEENSNLKNQISNLQHSHVTLENRTVLAERRRDEMENKYFLELNNYRNEMIEAKANEKSSEKELIKVRSELEIASKQKEQIQELLKKKALKQKNIPTTTYTPRKEAPQVPSRTSPTRIPDSHIESLEKRLDEIQKQVLVGKV